MVQRLLKVLSTYIGSLECFTLAARCTECISDRVVLNEGVSGGESVDIVTSVSASMNSMMQSREACILALAGLKGLVRCTAVFLSSTTHPSLLRCPCPLTARVL